MNKYKESLEFLYTAAKELFKDNDILLKYCENSYENLKEIIKEKERNKMKLRIKGFDKDLKCRGFQFEVGKEYKINSKELKLCSDTVFHYCKNIQQVHNYYDVTEDNRFCWIEVLGEEVTDGEKCGSNYIKIVREIVDKELNILIGRINGNTGIFNTGNMNTGYYNTGNRNTGDFNKCDYSSGFFCTQEPKVRIFDIETDMTVSKFRDSKWYDALHSAPFTLTKWVYYTEEEKANDKDKELIGGYLERYSYKEACANWWAKMSNKDKEIIKTIPNFNSEKFYEITGIEIKLRGEE